MSWTLYPAKIGNPDSLVAKSWMATHQTFKEMIVLSELEDDIVDRYRWKPAEKKVKPIKEGKGRKGPNIDEDFVGAV